MFGPIAKMLFVATSLTPIFVICAALSLSQADYINAGRYGVVFVCLTGILFAPLNFANKDIPPTTLRVTKFKPADKEVLTFLVSYLIPFLPLTSAAFGGEVLAAILIVGVIGLTVYYSNAYTFNPLLALGWGYHFYEVEAGGVTYLLVSRRRLTRPANDIPAKHLCDYLYIDDTKPTADDGLLPDPQADKPNPG